MRLIDADALAIDLHEWQMEAASRGFLNAYEVLDKVLSGLDDPRYTVDPVKHGRWTRWVQNKDEWPAAMCSECQDKVEADNEGKYPKYCPNCGAKMDK